MCRHYFIVQDVRGRVALPALHEEGAGQRQEVRPQLAGDRQQAVPCLARHPPCVPRRRAWAKRCAVARGNAPLRTQHPFPRTRCSPTNRLHLCPPMYRFLFNDQVYDNVFWNCTSGVGVWTAYEAYALNKWSVGVLQHRPPRCIGTRVHQCPTPRMPLWVCVWSRGHARPLLLSAAGDPPPPLTTLIAHVHAGPTGTRRRCTSTGGTTPCT